MVTVLFAVTAFLYAVACGLFLVLLTKGSETVGRWATRVLAASVVSHVVFLAADWAASGHPPAGDIYETMSIASLLMSAAYLVAARGARMRVLGAFNTPITLLFFLGAGLGRRVGYVPPNIRSALLPVHVGANLLGLTVFGLAFAVAVAYLVQERQLRSKHLGGLFHRLPALDVLDSLGLRLVTIGFPLLTLGVVTGTIWAVRLDPQSPAFTANQAFGFLAWLLFAAVLALRVSVGWRGRRAAIGTMLGFLCALAVLVGYVVRGSIGGTQ